MFESGSPAPFLFLIVLVLGIGIAAFLHQKKRRREYEEWAAGRGFLLDSRHDYSMEQAYPALGCLRSGSDRYAYDILTGQWLGRSIRAFHYHYETYSRNSKGHRTTHHHRLTVVSVHSDVPLQQLNIRSEGLLDKFASFFGAEDINFESAEFSRRHHVSAENRRWAYDVLHARSIEYLLGRPPRNIQLYSDFASAWFSSTYDPQQIEESLDTLCGLLDLIPDYVRRQQLETGGSGSTSLMTDESHSSSSLPEE